MPRPLAAGMNGQTYCFGGAETYARTLPLILCQDHSGERPVLLEQGSLLKNLAFARFFS